MTPEQIGIEVGKQFVSFFDELTNSDLQAVIEAEVRNRGLAGADALEADELALQTIYKETASKYAAAEPSIGSAAAPFA